PIAAFVDALASIGYDVRVMDYAEHALPDRARRGSSYPSNGAPACPQQALSSHPPASGRPRALAEPGTR
ncbi:hypothetical protein AB0A63_13755, partial [Lentzea sp. NPDC042327]|uniref:hypothetical protein n=1 Tax=Lentzea sp. NPDC042327 TaxID=3154801 RepID=UPI0033D919EF